LESAQLQDPLAIAIVAFLESIGLPVRVARISGRTFLPGITVQSGTLLVDEQQLLYPGDLLHEAGHLALLPPHARKEAGGEMEDELGLEIAAMAWSYAAALHVGIAPSILFHPDGYRGSSDSFVENFRAGRDVGVPLLEWAVLTAGKKTAKKLGIPAYPSMLRWLREADGLLPTAGLHQT